MVDEQRRTHEPSIFAIGDVVGEPMLAHKASHEGRVAVEVMAGENVAFAPRAIPAVVFTDPELAWCGLTEAQAAKEGRHVTVAKFPWGASGRAITLDRTDGLTKLILDPETERLLGVGLVGPGAGELIAEGVLAIEMGANATDLKLTIHPHPTLTETMMESAEVFFGQATHVYRPTLRDFAYDVRFALRSLRASMVVTATIVLCLGLGIGATGTAYAWLESVILQPLPAVQGIERLVTLKMTAASRQTNLSYPDYKEIRDQARTDARTLSDVAAFDIRRFTLRTDAAAESRLAEPLWGVLASANYFDVLGVRPVVGRAFLAGEDAAARGAPVIVISHALWLRRFAGGRDVIGRRVWINGRAVTIVGVAPPGFIGTVARLGMDLWMPITMQPEVAGNPNLLEEREARWLAVFGRLAAGATLASARASAQSTGARLAASFPADRDLGLTARVLDIGPVDRLGPLFAVMLGIAALVLLIVCSNVANLLLQRGAAREHEMAVRLALGARPARLVRQPRRG